MDEVKVNEPPPRTTPANDIAIGDREIINASGHKQKLGRQFNFLSISSIKITTGNVWAALGGSIVISLYNGGPPGVIYEFIAVSVFYWLIATCIAEMASAIPSSEGAYHWASIIGGKYGRVIGYFAGWENFFAWVFGTASMSSILANQVVSMYGLFHPACDPQFPHQHPQSNSRPIHYRLHNGIPLPYSHLHLRQRPRCPSLKSVTNLGNKDA